MSTNGNFNIDTEQNVRIVEPHEYKLATATLVAAFGDDPASTYLSQVDGRTPSQARQLLWEQFEYALYAHILGGLVLTIGNFESVACWMPPGRDMDEWLIYLRSGLWRMHYKLGAQGKSRFFGEYFDLLNDAKVKVLKEREHSAWCCEYIGTLPSAQGKGYGKKLMEYITDLADKEQAPCYLDSSNVTNIPFYNKLEFVVKETVSLNPDGVPIPHYCMIREPKPK